MARLVCTGDFMRALANGGRVVLFAGYQEDKLTDDQTDSCR